MADETGITGLWLALRKSIDGYLVPPPPTGPATSPVAESFQGLKQGDSFPFPNLDQVVVGTSGLVHDASGELMAWIFASKADVNGGASNVIIEDCVIKETLVNHFLGMSTGTTLKYLGEYDNNNSGMSGVHYNGAEGAIAKQNAAGNSVYRCTWTSRYYAPPSASSIAALPTTIAGTEYKLVRGNVVGHLFRHISTGSHGESLVDDAWLLHTGYTPPSENVGPVQISVVGSTFLHTFLGTWASDPSVALYSATSYRVRKYGI